MTPDELEALLREYAILIRRKAYSDEYWKQVKFKNTTITNAKRIKMAAGIDDIIADLKCIKPLLMAPAAKDRE